MNSRQLALLTRQLIAKCGGLGESARACLLSRSRLSDCQDPLTPATLSIRAVNVLELYCGEPVVSRALVEDRPAASSPQDLTAEACDTLEAAADLQRLVRGVLAADQLTPRKAAAIERDLMALVEHVRGAHAALLKEEGKTP